MVLTAANVNVGVTGAVYFGPTGTTLPTNASSTPAAGFTDLGYVTDAGVTESQSITTNDINAWQNAAVVRKLLTGHDLTYQVAFLETNDDVLGTFYDSYAAGVVQITGETGTRGAWVIDVVDGTDLIRTVIPDGEISERGDVSYVSGEAISYPITITCYPVAGVKAYKYFAGTGS